MAGSVLTRTPRSGGTGRHPLYLSIVPGDGVNGDRRAARRLALLRPLAGVIGDQLRELPPETRAIVEMLAVLNARVPLAQLGRAAEPARRARRSSRRWRAGWWTGRRKSPVARW